VLLWASVFLHRPVGWQHTYTAGEILSVLTLIKASAVATSIAAEELSPRADGHLSMHQQVRAATTAPCLFQGQRHADYIITPGTELPQRHLVQVELESFGEFRGTQHEFAVGTWRNGALV
jgi:hypothetical protein